MDFTVNDINLTLSLYCSTLFFIIVIFNLGFAINKKQESISNGREFLLFLLIAVFAVTDFLDGDFFHYKEVVQEFSIFSIIDVEEVYLLLIPAIDKNYLLFRIIIWGGALLFFCLTAKRYTNRYFLSLCTLSFMYLLLFSYARASLAMCLFFYGLSYYLKPLRHKYFGWLVGIVFIILSPLFHSSAWAAIALLPFLFFPINKYTIGMIILLFPFLVVISQNILFPLLLDTSLSNDRMNQKLAGYAVKQKEYGSAYRLLGTIRYLTFYISLIILTVVLFFRNNRVKSSCKRLYKMILGIILAATVFLFFDLDNLVFYYRILYWAIIPIVFLVTICYIEGYLSKKAYSLIILLGLFSQGSQCIYEIYCNIVK